MLYVKNFFAIKIFLYKINMADKKMSANEKWSWSSERTKAPQYKYRKIHFRPHWSSHKSLAG